MNKINEEFKIIKDFPNYKISNLGRIYNIKTEKYLTLQENKGYLQVFLYNNGIKKFFLVHRLVGEYFIPNLENKPEINHINGIKNINTVDNLEWCTRSENILHAYRTGLSIADDKRKKKMSLGNKCSRKVLQIDLNTNEIINEFNSISEAAKYVNCHTESIRVVCIGKRKSCKGFSWKF